MSGADFARAAEIFDAVLRLEENERSEYLDRACGSDRALREEVERLIECDQQPHALFASPPTPVRELLTPISGGDRPMGGDEPSLPDRIGEYEIEGRLGVGGMGVVYLARQKHPQRTVALKVIRAALATPGVMQRFENEAQALARLQHPGIAQIHEVGSSAAENGPQRFLVMEYVDGDPIIEYANRTGLDQRQRLELLRRVCAAVHHAHDRGVLHRDLKPGNILVVPREEDDAIGQPKILDFGVARILESQWDRGQTLQGQLIGTLAYMSPEQASGDPTAIDHRSDIYGLGVIAYELLCGERPIDVDQAPVHDAVRLIREHEPAPIGSRDRRLRGDIQTIVHTALEKDPARRYQSVADLAGDIRRYLDDEPVAARPASTFYQLRKYARRNRAALGVAATILVLAMAGTIVTVILSVRVEAERERRAEEEQRADASSSQAALATETAEWNDYAGALAAAEAAIRAHAVADAAARLAEAPRALRGWEWAHLSRRVDRSSGLIGPLPDAPTALACSPIDERVIVACADGTIQVRATPSGVVVQTIRTGSAQAIREIAMSPTGARIAVGEDTGRVTVWTLNAVPAATILEGHERAITGLAFNDRGTVLHTAALDRTVRRWDLARGEETARRELPGSIYALPAAPTRGLLAAVRRRGAVDFLQPETLDVLWTLELGRDFVPWSAAASVAGFVAVGGESGQIVTIAPQERKETRRWQAHDTAVQHLAFNPDGSRLLSASGDVARVWDAQLGTRLGTLLGHEHQIVGIDSVPGETIVTGATEEANLRRWSRDADDVPSLGNSGRDALRVRCTPDGSVVAVAAHDRLHVIDVQARRVVQTLMTPVYDIAFSDDGEDLWVLVPTGSLERRRTVDGSTVSSVPVDTKSYRLAVRPDQAVVAIGELRTGDVLLLDAADGQMIQRLDAHDSNILALEYSADGRWLFTGSEDDTARVFDATTLEPLATLSAHTEAIMDFALSADASVLATASADHTIRLWSTETWQTIAELVGHTNQVDEVAFVPGTDRLVSGAHDATLRFWQSPSGRPVATFRGHETCIWSLDVTPDGAWLITGGGDYAIRFWDR